QRLPPPPQDGLLANLDVEAAAAALERGDRELARLFVEMFKPIEPAVTVAFAAVGAFPWREVPAYVLGQLVAAVLASAALVGLVGSGASLGATVPAVELGAAFGLEVILTFFLMFVITAVATDARAHGQLAAVAIGGTVALCALMGGPLTGASMNPARSLGPALVSGVSESQWLYVVAPIAGALLGAFAYRAVALDPPRGAAAG
ncbi:MAG: aquaporin, partial [Myxococcota bacterium]